MPYDKNRDSFRSDRTGAPAYRGPRTGAPRRDVPPAVRDDAPDGRRGDGFPKNRDFNRSFEGRHPENRSYNRNYEGNRPERREFNRDFENRRPERRDFDRGFGDRRPEKPAFERKYDNRRPAPADHRPPQPERRPYAAPADRPPQPERRPYAAPVDRPPQPERRPYDAPVDRPPQPERRPYDAPEAPAFRPAPIAPEMPENLLVGRNPIREAIKAGREIEKLLVAKGDLSGSAREIVAKAHEARIVVQEVDRSRLDAIYPNHQGLIAYTSAARYAQLEDIFDRAAERHEDPFIVILDGVTDPHNLGAIIRTAECVGAHGVIVPERRSAGLTPAAVKAAAGGCEYMNVVRVVNLNRTLEELKERGVWIVGTTLSGENALRADLAGPIALVIGSEDTGIAELTLKKCDRLLSLPMAGHLDSLNASVAAGVMMYAVMNARKG